MSVNGLNTHKMNFTKWYIILTKILEQQPERSLSKGGRYVDTLLKTQPYIGRIEPFLTTFYFFRTNQNEFQYQS